jgi:hypothetical protein
MWAERVPPVLRSLKFEGVYPGRSNRIAGMPVFCIFYVELYSS